MAVYLSPGTYTREIDLSVLPTAVGALTPAFIGTANKGPVNEPTFVSNAQQYIDTFGEPFPESFLGYAVLAYFEEGARAWILRVGVECEEGQATALSSICIDTSGAREGGWGRVALFKGIAPGKICTREISSSNPLVFHNALVSNINYNESTSTDSNGPTDASMSFTDRNGYTGAVDDSYTMIITSDPTEYGSGYGPVHNAEFNLVRQSDGEVITGTLTDQDADGTSDTVTIVWPDGPDGLEFTVTVTQGGLREGDTFTWDVRPDNLEFGFIIDFGEAGTSFSPNQYFLDSMENATSYGLNPDNSDAAAENDRLVSYTSASDFATEFNVVAIGDGGTGFDYEAVAQSDGTACIQTSTVGKAIQIAHSEAFALEIGVTLYTYDIPRAHLMATDYGPYKITSENNTVDLSVHTQEESVDIQLSLPSNLNATSEEIVAAIGELKVSGVTYLAARSMFVPGGYTTFVLVTDESAGYDNTFSSIEMYGDYSHIKTLRFVEETGIVYPYKDTYEPFYDSRVTLPDYDINGASVSGDTADIQYLANITGYLVAKSPGTWIDEYKVVLEYFRDRSDPQPNRYRLRTYDNNSLEVDSVEDISFDPRETRYIANVINEGSTIGGTNGNSFWQWIDRPSFLDNDADGSDSDSVGFEVRHPAPISFRATSGAANGIPDDPAYSSELDRAVIGNPARETGIFAFQNPEVYDITLLLAPGFSSGSVIGQALQMCEGRGDCLFVLDPPFGLRPQQVVDWHNGMLFSDLGQAINSSYGALYFPWLKIYDQYNGDELFIPPSGHVSSVFARTASVGEQWFAPAGLRRGRLLTPIDVEVNLTQGERDLLYGFRNAVNPIVNFPQDGITIWGQRTLQRTQSALDRVNVRMLLIYIKKNATVFLRDFIFEPNDAITRSQVVSASNSFLADIQARRGLSAYKVVCDESNNTPERIDRNELWVSYFLKPVRAVEFIVLNLVVLRTEQSFSADEVLSAGGVVTTA